MKIKRCLSTLFLSLCCLVIFVPTAFAVGSHSFLGVDLGPGCMNHSSKCTKCGSTSYSKVTYIHHHYLTIPNLKTGKTEYDDYDYPEYKCKKCGTLWNGQPYKHTVSIGSKKC